jgi:chromosome segregation protein
MRLKKLILHGFKSFADRTEFSFDTPITGIVGPNGCGKSNVVDGFKWVLGEQSAKSLRGEAMLDVIFNGSSTRKPTGMAEVTLVFENPVNGGGRRSLNLDVDEVAVGRRLFRDGTSEYQINNQSSRLKDVRELFLDTGVGVDAYSVIEQGRVAALLDANPQERRLIFEEAAGISKFKQRKKEAQRKLERVDQNLLRVNDIVEELEKRLRGVKMQATRAKTYQEHSSRLSELRLSYSLHEYHLHKTKLADVQAERDDAQFRLDDASGDLATAQNQLAGERDRLTKLTDQKQAVERDLLQARASAQSARQRQQYANQQLAQMAEQLATFAEDQTRLEESSKSLTQSLEAEKLNLARLTEELGAQRRLIDERQQGFGDCQMRLASLDRQREQAKSAILDAMRKLAAVNSRLGAVEIEQKNVASQRTRLEERRRVVDGELARLATVREELQGRLEKTTALMNAQQAELAQKRAAASALGKQIALVGEQFGAAREHRCGLVSRQKLLEDLEARREGVSEGVQSVLRQRQDKFPFVRGLVADVLRVDIEHAPVVEAALDGRDQWIVTDDSAAATAARESLAELEGRVNLLCADTIGSGLLEPYDWLNCPHPVRLAIDLVRFEPRDAAVAQALLGKTAVVETLAAAADLRSKGPAGFRFVTHDGEVLESDGTLKAGPLSSAMGLLSRRSELVAIGQQIDEVDGRIAQLSKQLADDNSVARALEEDIGKLGNAIYASNTQKVQIGSALAQNSDQRQALGRERPVLEAEIASLSKLLEQLSGEQTTLAEKKAAMEQEQAERTGQVEQLSASHKAAAEELGLLGEQLTAARVQFGQVQEKELASSQAVRRQTAATSEMQQQLARLTQSAATISERRKGVENELAAAVQSEKSLSLAESECKTKLDGLTAQLAQITQSTNDLSFRVEMLRQGRQDVEQELHKLDRVIGEQNVRLQTLIQRTLDDLQLDVVARYDEATSDGKEYQPGDVDFDAVAAEIKELREKIQRLGNVNVEAINELSELEQRQQFLSGQMTDLTSSKQQLVELIEEINKESGARFEATFNAVREHFQGMFRKLFGGGKADVFLETEIAQPAEIGAEGQAVEASVTKVDILDAGIEIIARPPGKHPVSISQLSGGEKTMTCVALLMSIFKSKPSPFCILDEVDAALDEANNERFNTVVQEFLDQSQFIVITHSKRTMAIAQMLYGVTMQEQGVSKRVAVKFDQVDAHGQIAESAAA